jgi:hypothetical protein
VGCIFVAVTTAANEGVPAHMAGLAAGLVNTSQQLGGALGLAIFSALATARTHDLLAGGSTLPVALTGGYRRALLAAAIFLLVSAFIALRTAKARSEATAIAEHADVPATPVPAAES